MKANRRAVIDVGTNSVKLLVADVHNGVVEPVVEQSEQTRLGAGFYETCRLQPQAVAHTARAVAAFAAKAQEMEAFSMRVIATSAVRDAVNPTDLTSAIEKASGLKVEIISGGQEAAWVFRGVTTAPELASQSLLLLDVGGGSTEFILGRGGEKHFAKSYPLGTVRLLEHLPHGDLPSVTELAANRKWVKDFLANTVRPDLEPALMRETGVNSGQWPVQLIGTGGTAVILARMEARIEGYDRGRIEATRLGIVGTKAVVQRLWGLPLAERQKITGLPRDRADVILPGVVIYEGVMEQFGFQELRVSTRGLRFAAVMDAA